MTIEFRYNGIEDFLNVLRDQKRDAERHGFDLLAFSQVEHDFLNRHEVIIEQQKMRIFEYAPDKQRLVIKLPIHGVFVIQGMIFKHLDRHMVEVGMNDDDWMLLTGGDFELENGCTRTVEPDLALYCMAGKREERAFPLIVFEIAISQSVEELRSRADDYIGSSKGEINAVVCLRALRNQGRIDWTVYKASRRPDQDQTFEATLWGHGSIMFDKDDHGGQYGLPVNITATGPMIIPMRKTTTIPDTPNQLELAEGSLIKITKGFIMRR